MRRLYILIISLTVLLIGGTVAAQEQGEPDEATNAAAEATEVTVDDNDDAAEDQDSADGSEASDDTEEPDDADLDLQTYEQDDDDFVPTEEIPADQAVPFPSDI